MTEYTDVLERARQEFGSSDLPIERVFRRHERRRRNRRIGTVVVALAIAALAIGGSLRVLNRSLAPQPAHHGITQDNVEKLKPAWSARLDGKVSQIDIRSQGVVQTFPPTVANGKVFVATGAGKLYAFDAACGSGGATCAPLWVADAARADQAAAGKVDPIWEPPTVADGLVFVSATGGHLLAFPEDCGVGGATCSPIWVAETDGPIDEPAISDGILYGLDGRHGVVYAFAEDCGTGGATCRPLWTAHTEPSNMNPSTARVFIWKVAVSDGVVFAVGASDHPDQVYAFDAATGRRLWWARSPVPPTGGSGQTITPVVANGYVLVDFRTLYAYSVSCRADGGRCDPAWTLPGAGFFPVVSGGVAYINDVTDPLTAGTISAARTDCGTGGSVCRPLWSATTDTGFGELVVGDGMLFTVSQFGEVTLEAFPASCDQASCEASWMTGHLGSPRLAPVVENGVVYVATEEGRVFAFPVDCGTGGATCEPLWQGSGTSPPAILGSMLFTASADGQLNAFELPSQAATTSSRRSSRDGSTTADYLVAALVLFSGMGKRARPRPSR